VIPAAKITFTVSCWASIGTALVDPSILSVPSCPSRMDPGDYMIEETADFELRFRAAAWSRANPELISGDRHGTVLGDPDDPRRECHTNRRAPERNSAVCVPGSVRHSLDRSGGYRTTIQGARKSGLGRFRFAEQGASRFECRLTG